MSDWVDVRRAFESVVELDAGARARALVDLPEHVRRQVERLLAEDESVISAAIDAPPDLDALARATDATRLRRVGAYEIVRVLGTGGMGTVFEAVQDNPRRTVALKVLRALVGSERARRRLEFEAETLARLHHPNIAHVHEAGTWRDPDTGEESPFFALEFVPNAHALTAHADVRGLGLRARIELFRTVCDAVHHGHQMGVLHRDLKPANVLVGEDGRAKVIDFGIARAVDRGGADRSEQTLEGQAVGTPGYMSPEQLEGGPVDTRTDVYALGATLYELLTGVRPFARGDESLTHFLERVKHQAPLAPSTIGSSPIRVPTELDPVVLCALSADPDRRYPSASELAADLGRFLRNEPVTARPPSASYVMRKFVERHRALVTVASVGLVLVVAGAIAATAGWLRAIEAESEARLEVATQAAVTDYMLALIRRARADRAGRDARIADMLDDSEELIGELAADRPEVAAAMREVVAQGYLSLELPKEALVVFERALESARAELPDDHRLVFDIRYHRALALSNLGRHEEALPEFEQLLLDRTARYGATDGPVARIQVALSVSLAEQGEYEAAQALLRQAVRTFAWFADNAGESGDRLESRRRLARTRSSLCFVLIRQGQHEEALAIGEAALGEIAGLFGEHEPYEIQLRQRVAVCLSALDRDDEAIAQMRAIVRAYERIDPEATAVRVARNDLAVALQAAGQLDAAIAEFEAVLVAETSAGQIDRQHMIRLFNLATTLERADRIAESAARFGELFALLDERKSISEDHWLVGQFRKGFGVCLRRLGEYPDAETELRAGLEALEATFPVEHRRVQAALRELVELYREWDRPEQAAAVAARLVDR